MQTLTAAPPRSAQVRGVERREFGVTLVQVAGGPAPSDCYVLAVPLDRGGRPTDHARIGNPGGPAEPLTEQPTLLVRISRDVVADELAAMLGRPADGAAAFEGDVDLAGSAGRGLRSLLEQLGDELLGGQELLTHPQVLLRQVRTLAAALLLSQQHSFTAPLVLGQSPSRPRTLCRALRFMAEHLADPLTLDDLAGSAGCSARTLNTAFRDHLGVTPMTYLRNLRLERVRDELLAGDDLVGTVAYRWGFTHLGRFAGVYAQRFGERPSQTVCRGGR